MPTASTNLPALPTHQLPQLPSSPHSSKPNPPSLKSMAIGILRGCPLGASMRLEEEGGARWTAGDCACGVAAPLLGWLVRLSVGASDAADALDGTPVALEGVLLRLAGAEAAATVGRGTWVAAAAGAAQVREATLGTSATDTWMWTGAPRAWPGLLGEAGGGVEEGTDTM